MQQLLPAILGWLSAAPDPDLGLLALRRLTEGYNRSSTLDRRFATLLALLETHRATAGSAGSIPGSPFVSYDSLTPAQVKALAVEVDTISEPLGQITGTLAGT